MVAFKSLFDQLNPTCSKCHATGAHDAPRFLAPTADETYALFKGRNFDRAPSALMTKDIHAGPSLTAAQQKAVLAWIEAE